MVVGQCLQRCSYLPQSNRPPTEQAPGKQEAKAPFSFDQPCGLCMDLINQLSISILIYGLMAGQLGGRSVELSTLINFGKPDFWTIEFSRIFFSSGIHGPSKFPKISRATSTKYVGSLGPGVLFSPK